MSIYAFVFIYLPLYLQLHLYLHLYLYEHAVKIAALDLGVVTRNHFGHQGRLQQTPGDIKHVLYSPSLPCLFLFASSLLPAMENQTRQDSTFVSNHYIFFLPVIVSSPSRAFTLRAGSWELMFLLRKALPGMLIVAAFRPFTEMHMKRYISLKTVPRSLKMNMGRFTTKQASTKYGAVRCSTHHIFSCL